MSFSNQLNTSKEQYKKAWSMIILGVINYNWRDEIGINLIESDHEDLCSFSKSSLYYCWNYSIALKMIKKSGVAIWLWALRMKMLIFCTYMKGTMYNKDKGKKVMWFRISVMKGQIYTALIYFGILKKCGMYCYWKWRKYFKKALQQDVLKSSETFCGFQ